MKTIQIAIDGPCGAGKSTIAKMVAKELHFAYLDTGAMYRALALKAVRLGFDVKDEKQIQPMLGNTNIDIEHSRGAQRVLLDKEDVSNQIREHDISKAASDISKLPCVRLHLVTRQRQIAGDKNVVVDGRDIGSFVLPNADVKIYLTAKAEIRAKRRYDELIEKGQKADFETVLKDVNDRDYNDMNRDFAPLVKCADAIEIDSSFLTACQVCEKIISEVKRVL